MYLIAGLGNPDRKYENTRHNVGFKTIDRISEKLGISVTTKKFRAYIGQGFVNGEKVILAKPQTYMNLSGESIREIAEFYDIPPENILVFCDDVYLEMGTMRIREKGSAGGHNGLKNIILQLASTDFMRIRLGVGPQPAGMPLEVFVLMHMTKTEEKQMADVYEDGAEAAITILKDGIATAMNRFNGKKK